MTNFLEDKRHVEKIPAKKFTKFAVHATETHPIAKLGTNNGFTAETFLSNNSSTGMSTSEMLATEVFTTEMSAAEISTVDMYRRNIPY